MTIKPIQTRYKGYRFKGSQAPAQSTKKMSARADRAGRRFGRLIAVECLGLAPAGYRWWGCVCDCGSRVAVRSRELDRGHTKSCGCLRREIVASGAGANKLPQGEASKNELRGSYIRSAKGRGIEWALTPEQFDAVVTGACVYCGAERDRERRPNKGVNGGFMFTGIDRVDNSKGYVLGNVVPCCWDCNRAKGTLSLPEFERWLDRIAAARSARFEFGQEGATA